jgi:hypothetical protein
MAEALAEASARKPLLERREAPAPRYVGGIR